MMGNTADFKPEIPLGDGETVKTFWPKTDSEGRYKVNVPVYDVYGRLSRYETKRMYPEEYQKAQKKDKKVHAI